MPCPRGGKSFINRSASSPRRRLGTPGRVPELSRHGAPASKLACSPRGLARRGRGPGEDYFLSAPLSASPSATVPPLALQAFSVMSVQPLPLQPFWPLQALSADLQPPLPLQALTPAQWTLPAASAEVAGSAEAKRPATAAASNAPLVVILI